MEDITREDGSVTKNTGKGNLLELMERLMMGIGMKTGLRI